MSGHVERLEARLNGTHRVHHALGEPHPSMVLVDEPDLRAALDELKQLRAERPGRGFLAQAYANGWHDAIASYRAPGWHEREAGWKKYIAEVDGESVPQQPERGGEAGGA